MNFEFFAAGDTFDPFKNSYMPITISKENPLRFKIPNKTTIEGEDWVAVSTGLIHDPNTSAVDVNVELWNKRSNDGAESFLKKLNFIESNIGDGVKPTTEDIIHFNERGLQGVYYLNKLFTAESFFGIDYYFLKVSGKFITTALTPDKLNEKKNPYIIYPRDLREVLGATGVKDAFAKLRELSSKGDFSKLRLGDYIDLVDGFNDGYNDYTWDPTYENLRCQIVAFDHYYKICGTNQHHVVMQFKNCYKRKRLHIAETVAGGYESMELNYTLLKNYFKTGLTNAIGIEPIEVTRIIDGVGKEVESKNSVFLPTEVEIIGHQAWGHYWNSNNTGYPTGTSMQYPYYAITPQNRVKYYNRTPTHWWTASPAYTSDPKMAVIDDNGNSMKVWVTNEDGGIAPCFCI